MPNFQSGGAFLPSGDYSLTGAVNFVTAPTIGGTATTAGTSTIVGSTDTQTLTNKTLTSPTITGATISGTTAIGNGATLTTPVLVNPAIDTIKSNAAITGVAAGFATDTYLAGSGIAIPTSGFLAKMYYVCVFDMVKTAAGSAQFTIVLRIGTGGGVVGDTAIMTFAFAAGTAAIDSGRFIVEAEFRTVGSGTSAVLAGAASCSHALAATGLISTGASGWGYIPIVSSGFDSTIAATTIGISVNGGASFSGTNNYVRAELRA